MTKYLYNVIVDKMRNAMRERSIRSNPLESYGAVRRSGGGRGNTLASSRLNRVGRAGVASVKRRGTENRTEKRGLL